MSRSVVHIHTEHWSNGSNQIAASYRCGPYEALRTGTVNVATFIKSPDSGTIKVGNVSDLVLLGGNPLSDINQTANVQGVMLGKNWLSSDYIRSELQKQVKK